MAGKGKVPVIHVVVCGLTSSSFQGMSGQGAGKSVLCNRFIRPNQDDLRLEHNTVLNLSEFGSNVINNTHFLYWGEKLAGMDDGQTVRFQIVEHTEFVDDSSLKPFPHTKPYHKRVTQLKLQCSGKTTYIESDQLSLPEVYKDVGRFPDKFTIDGFVVCVDVSTDFSDPHNPQKEFFERLLSNVLEAKKKPVVVALTKYDRANEGSVSIVEQIVAKSKKQIPLIEVSALRGVNVELCFLVLAHLVDTRKPRSKMVTYSESKGLRDSRIKHNEENFQKVLDTSLTKFDTKLEDARQMLESQVEFKLLTELCGTERVNRLIKAKLRYLKQELVKRKETAYIEMLPHIFSAILPNLELSATLKNCKEALHCSTKFPKYFVDVKNWKEDVSFLNKEDTDHVPFEIVDDDSAEEFLQKHIDDVLKEQREEAACAKIQEVLNHSVGLQPGIDMDQLWSDLGVANDATHVHTDRLIKIYHDCMGSVEQQCLAELEELLLERHDIFDNNISDDVDMIGRVSEELKDYDCFKRLDKRHGIRQSQILKHVGGLQVPERSIYGRSHLGEGIKSLIAEGMLSREKLMPPSFMPKPEQLQWILDPKDIVFNLSILARTMENAITLRSDFMNHLSGGGNCQVDNRTYQLDMSLFFGDDIDTMTNEDFVPQGAVAVVNTMECLDWLEKVLTKHWIPTADSNSPYRGMPLVILALDGTAEPDVSADNPQSPLHQGAKRLANIVQCVCMMERPTPQPKRLVVTAVIHQVILSLINGVTHVDDFLNSKLSADNPRGLNIAVCTLKDDPYPIERLLTPWLHHQLVSGHEGEPTALFLRSAIDKQHRTCTLTFHSSLNLKDIMSFVRLGIILVYSTERHASLAVMKSLLSKLPALLPKLVVAMATNGSHDNKLLEEGRELANGANALFTYNNGEDLQINFGSDFVYKCWFSRFTSYNAQEISGEIRQQLIGRNVQTRRLPDRPPFLSSEPVLQPAPPPPGLSSRHSIGAFLDRAVCDPNSMTDGPSTPVGGTLPRPPSRSKQAKSSSIEEDDGTYSDPIELIKGLKQKKQATLERQRMSRVGTTPPQFLSPTHTLRYDSSENLQPKTISLENILQNGSEGDYASVQDAVPIARLASPEATSSVPLPTLRGKSPSMSPPPIPRRADHPNVSNGYRDVVHAAEVEEEDPSGMYATVQKTATKKNKSGGKHGYDHLPITQDSLGYDHLLPHSDDSDTPLETYATIDEPGQGQGEEQMYATVDNKTRNRPPPPKSRPPPKVPPRRDSRLTSSPGSLDYQASSSEKQPQVRGSSKVTSRTPPPMSKSPLLTQQKVHQGQNGDAMYSTVLRPASTSRHKRHASADNLLNGQVRYGGSNGGRPHPLPGGDSGRPPPHPGGAENGDNDMAEMYATVQKSTPREKPAGLMRQSVTPEDGGPTYSVPERRPKRAPPPTAPKPKGRQTPSPIQGYRPSLANYRSESFDAGLQSDLRNDRSMSTGMRRRTKSSITPPESSDSRTASLPKDFRGLSTHNGMGTPPPSHLHATGVTPPLPPPPESEVDEEAPSLPERNYSITEMGLEEEAPPLPPRLYSWSDVEDNDDELFQSDDDLDDLSAPVTISDHQKIYSSISRLSLRTPTMSGIEDIYNVVNKMAAVPESMPQDALEESAYDTLESVVKSIRTENQENVYATPSSPTSVTSEKSMESNLTTSPEPRQPTTPTTPLGLQSSTPLTPRELKVIKQQQKLLEKLQKKAQKEADRRRQQEEKKRRRDRKGKKGKKEERTRYFGSSLDSVVESDGVPVFIKKCVQIIEDRGLKAEGIYRVSGKKEDCLTLQGKYDEDHSLDIGSLGYCEAAISSTLKAFFKLLPDPLISDDIAAKVLVINSLDADSQRTRIHEILGAMPRPNLKTLKYLVKHLYVVHQNQDINKMTASNLAIVFWPTLMRPPLIDLADSSKQLGWQLVMTRLIEHPDFIPDVD